MFLARLFVYLSKSRIFSALAVKNIQANLMFLARLFVYLYPYGLKLYTLLQK